LWTSSQLYPAMACIKPSLNSVAYKQWSVTLRFASAAENYKSKPDSLAIA
jgi:hypothetical protein